MRSTIYASVTYFDNCIGKKFWVAVLILISSANIFATDLIVLPNGGSGTFSTITAAITAASEGDRILIYPQGGTTPYIENLAVNKGLTIENALQGQTIYINGSITTVLPYGLALNGLHINGSVTVNGQTTISSCYIAGDITASNSQGAVNLLADQDTIYGHISFMQGRVSGCHIFVSDNSPCINVTDVYHITGGRIDIVGNYIYSYGSAPIGIQVNNGLEGQSIRNNYIMVDGTDTTQSGYGIYIAAGAVGSGPGPGYCTNNTVLIIDKGINSGIYAKYTTGIWDFENNIVLTNGGAYIPHGAYNFVISSAPSFLFNYNFARSFTSYAGLTSVGITSNVPVNNTNVLTDQSIVINTITGQLTSGQAIDGGCPADVYTDIDLTRNDAGCYGGPYSLTNFNNAAASNTKVLFMTTPPVVIANSTMSFTGVGGAK